MNCFKLTIAEDRFGSKSSRKVAMKVIRVIYKEINKLPSNDIGMAFIETETFPKEYYFGTLNKHVLEILVSKWKAEKVECTTAFVKLGKKINYLGNRKLILPPQKDFNY